MRAQCHAQRRPILEDTEHPLTFDRRHMRDHMPSAAVVLVEIAEWEGVRGKLE